MAVAGCAVARVAHFEGAGARTSVAVRGIGIIARFSSFAHAIPATCSDIDTLSASKVQSFLAHEIVQPATGEVRQRVQHGVDRMYAELGRRDEKLASEGRLGARVFVRPKADRFGHAAIGNRGVCSIRAFEERMGHRRDGDSSGGLSGSEDRGLVKAIGGERSGECDRAQSGGR